MARDYGKIYTTFWTGETGRQIRSAGADPLIIAAYLLTAPTSNMIGLYYLPISTISYDTGRPFKGVAKALISLSKIGFAMYDEATEIVFVPNMARYEIGKTLKTTDNRHKYVVDFIEKHRKSRYINDFYELYGDAFNLPAKPLVSPLEGGSKVSGSQQPKQQQQQQPEQQQDPKQQQQPEHSLVAGATEGASDSDRIREVFAHYRTYHERAFPIPDSKSNEWKKIAARFREGYTVGDLCAAIDGCHRSPFHMGENDRQKPFNSLELIVRDGSHVNEFLKIPARRGPVLSVKTQRNAAALQGVLENFPDE